jgi:hypothetical protein
MFSVINPATEEVVTTVPSTSLEQTDEAIARSHEALKTWREVTPGDRANLLRRFSDIVRAHEDELALLEVVNSGHTIGNARWEVNNIANVLQYYSGSPERLFGRQIPVPGGIDMTFKEPVGVVGVIVPWNFPMPIAGWGLAPALARSALDDPLPAGEFWSKGLPYRHLALGFFRRLAILISRLCDSGFFRLRQHGFGFHFVLRDARLEVEQSQLCVGELLGTGTKLINVKKPDQLPKQEDLLLEAAFLGAKKLLPFVKNTHDLFAYRFGDLFKKGSFHSAGNLAPLRLRVKKHTSLFSMIPCATSSSFWSAKNPVHPEASKARQMKAGFCASARCRSHFPPLPRAS